MKKQVQKVVKDVKTFVVDRKKWLRGEGDENSCLLTRGNRMCCLGFYAEACGLDRKVIRNIATPSNAVKVTKGEPTAVDREYREVSRKSDVVWKTKLVNISGDDSITCGRMMSVNDDEDITDEVRETKLTALFKALGIKVKFK